MAYSKTIPYTGGITLYVKPVADGSLPSNTPSWATDAILQNSTAFGGVTFTGLTDNQIYWVFERAGGSPANTDLNIGIINPPTDVSSLSANITAILNKTNLIGTNTAFISAPATGTTLNSPLIINDTYSTALGNAFEFVFIPPAGSVIGSSSCKFGGKKVDGNETWLVTGTLTNLANPAGEWKAIFEIDNSVTSTLVEGFYNWTAEFSNGTEKKTIARGTRVKWTPRYTD